LQTCINEINRNDWLRFQKIQVGGGLHPMCKKRAMTLLQQFKLATCCLHQTLIRCMGLQAYDAWNIQKFATNGNGRSDQIPWIRNDSWPISSQKHIVHISKVSNFHVFHQFFLYLFICKRFHITKEAFSVEVIFIALWSHQFYTH
jgi:hypothetical protein